MINAYSQQAFFEHSPLANRAEKLGVAALEKTASLFDARYEIVVFAARGPRWRASY